MGLPLIYTNGYKWRIFHVYVILLERRWNPGTHTNLKCCSLVGPNRLMHGLGLVTFCDFCCHRLKLLVRISMCILHGIPPPGLVTSHIAVCWCWPKPSQSWEPIWVWLFIFPFTSKFSPYGHISYYQKFDKALGNWAEIFKEAYVHPRRSEISRSIDEVDESAWCSQERGNPIELNSQLGKRCLKSCSLLIYMLSNNWTRQGENLSWFLDGAPITEEENTTYIEEIFHCHVWLPQDICMYVYIYMLKLPLLSNS